MDLPAAISHGWPQRLESASTCFARDKPSGICFTARNFGAALLSYEIRPSNVEVHCWKDYLPGAFIAAQQLRSSTYTPYKSCIYTLQ